MNLTKEEKRFLSQNAEMLNGIFAKRRQDLLESASQLNPLQHAPWAQSIRLEQAKEYSHIWPELIRQIAQERERGVEDSNDAEDSGADVGMDITQDV